MSIASFDRTADINEIAAEMDRRGNVIEQLEARLVHIDGIYKGAIDNLNHHQTQLDMDGIMVGVSRQALCEVLAGLEAALISIPADPAPAPADVDQGPLDWAVEKWHQEVANRPLKNVHRAALDTTWRQVIRHFGGDPDALCGPDHYELVEKNPAALSAAPAGNVTPQPVTSYRASEQNDGTVSRTVGSYTSSASDVVEALREAIEFAEQDFQALTPAGEVMVGRWRTALSAQGWRTPGEFQELHIIFQDDGGPANLRFVEVETPDGKSVRAGTWLKRDGYDVLALTVHKSDLPAAPSEGHAALDPKGLEAAKAAIAYVCREKDIADAITAYLAATTPAATLIEALASRSPNEMLERRFEIGERVTKIKGSSWTGRVVGFYATALTPIGYCVESENEPGSVQIYPEAAIRAMKEPENG